MLLLILPARIGPSAKFRPFVGLVIEGPPNVSTVALLNVVRAIHSTQHSSPPRMIVVSAGAVTKASMAHVAFPARQIVAWVLRAPNMDKRGMEALVFHGWGKEYEKDMTPLPQHGILPPDWKTVLPPEGWAKSVVILRPPRLTDGKETGKYGVFVDTAGGSVMSRKDLANFVVDDLLNDWSRYEGHIIALG